jgi:hypothetical protein
MTQPTMAISDDLRNIGADLDTGFLGGTFRLKAAVVWWLLAYVREETLVTDQKAGICYTG